MGELLKAQDLAQSIIIPFSRAEVLSAVAVAYVKLKEFDAALRVAGEIDVQCFKEKALIQIVMGYLRQGRKKEACAIIENSQDAAARSRIYAAIIKNYLQSKEYGPALATSQKIENLEIKTAALIEIAKELQKKRVFGGEVRKAFLESLDLLRY